MKQHFHLVLLLCVAMFTLACIATPAAIPTSTVSSVPRPTATQEVMTVIAETLHIRDNPSGVVQNEYKQYGDKVTVLERKGNWCKIERSQWVACWWLK